MLRYYSVEQLYNETNIDDFFLDSFDVLSDSVKEIVLKKNHALKAYLRDIKEIDYHKIDFSQERIVVEKLYINIKDENDGLCPIHAEPLQRKSIVLKMETKNFGVLLDTCLHCKKIYAHKDDEKIKQLHGKNYPYEIITNEEKKYED